MAFLEKFTNDKSIALNICNSMSLQYTHHPCEPVSHSHRRTGMRFTEGVENILPENNNFP